MLCPTVAGRPGVFYVAGSPRFILFPDVICVWAMSHHNIREVLMSLPHGGGVRWDKHCHTFGPIMHAEKESLEKSTMLGVVERRDEEEADLTA